VLIIRLDLRRERCQQRFVGMSSLAMNATLCASRSSLLTANGFGRLAWISASSAALYASFKSAKKNRNVIPQTPDGPNERGEKYQHFCSSGLTGLG
jgi:hypothetical protein